MIYNHSYIICDTFQIPLEEVKDKKTVYVTGRGGPFNVQKEELFLGMYIDIEKIKPYLSDSYR